MVCFFLYSQILTLLFFKFKFFYWIFNAGCSFHAFCSNDSCFPNKRKSPTHG
uniref:Glycoprotein n=1 Tax=Siphoviridae sp. ctj0M16 TaxID=2827918 RepID=A0A8S5S769_9CAUD|nr:MAG TPA: glycoprotein [Siphoviridae sp. ctj0M16]